MNGPSQCRRVLREHGEDGSVECAELMEFKKERERLYRYVLGNSPDAPWFLTQS